MESLYFGVFMYAMGGVMLCVRSKLENDSRVLWGGLWCGGVGCILLLVWSVCGDLGTVVFPLFGAILFGVFVSFFFRFTQDSGCCC